MTILENCGLGILMVDNLPVLYQHKSYFRNEKVLVWLFRCMEQYKLHYPQVVFRQTVEGLFLYQIP